MDAPLEPPPLLDLLSDAWDDPVNAAAMPAVPPAEVRSESSGEWVASSPVQQKFGGAPPLVTGQPVECVQQQQLEYGAGAQLDAEETQSVPSDGVADVTSATRGKLHIVDDPFRDLAHLVWDSAAAAVPAAQPPPPHQ